MEDPIITKLKSIILKNQKEELKVFFSKSSILFEKYEYSGFSDVFINSFQIKIDDDYILSIKYIRDLNYEIFSGMEIYFLKDENKNLNIEKRELLFNSSMKSLYNKIAFENVTFKEFEMFISKICEITKINIF